MGRARAPNIILQPHKRRLTLVRAMYTGCMVWINDVLAAHCKIQMLGLVMHDSRSVLALIGPHLVHHVVRAALITETCFPYRISRTRLHFLPSHSLA